MSKRGTPLPYHAFCAPVSRGLVVIVGRSGAHRRPRDPGRRRKIERVAPASLAILTRHAWPGNVRELRNVLAYAYATGDGPLLLPADLPPELLSPESEAASAARDETGEAPTAASDDLARLREALRRASGNRERAAAALGISRVTLWRRMRDVGLTRQRRLP